MPDTPRHRLLALLLLAFAGAWAAAEEPTPTEPEPAALDLGEAAPPPEERQRRWYVFLGAINAYPRLESEKLIRRYFDPTMAFLAPRHDDVTTVSTMRDLALIWQPQVGVGYVLNDYVSFAVQVGYMEGKVRTKQTHRSILLLPLHTDFEIRRGAAFVGVGMDLHPLGMAPLKSYKTWGERFRGIRPTVGGRLTWTYALFKARVRVGLEPFENVGINLSDYWFIPSLGTNVGLTMPMGPRQQIAANFGYNWFLSEEQDFNAYSLSMEWRYFFR
jgi:hypothetical protein